MKLILLITALLLHTMIAAQSAIVYARDPVPGFAHQRISVEDMRPNITFRQQIIVRVSTKIFQLTDRDKTNFQPSSPPDILIHPVL
ncbi:MAG: hypothetical protein WAZ36_10485 [Sediminibacterium sp.]